MNLISRARRSAQYRLAQHRPAQRRAEARATRYLASHPQLAAMVEAVREQHLTFLTPAALTGLAEAMQAIEDARIQGAVIEAGAALGGSAIVLAASKAPDRQMFVYDTFGMIPPPSEKDGADVHQRYEIIAAGKSKGIGGKTYYGYREDLLGEVRDSFERLGVAAVSNGVQFLQGVYEDSMVVDFPVALAHVDCDWYESVMTCLDRIEPHLVPGGRFIIDDYDAWSGARKAVDEFFAGRSGYRFDRQARLHIVKV